MVGRIADLLDHRLLERHVEQRAVLGGADPLELAMGSHHVVAHAQGHAAVAGPAVGGRVRDEARADRIQLDVALAILEVAPGLDDGRAVAALPQGAGAAVEPVDVRDVAAADVLHHPRDGERRRPGGEDVHVVAHEDVGVERDLVGLRRELHASQKVVTVGFLEEDVLAVVPAHDHVLRDSGNEDAPVPSHGVSTAAP